MLSIINHNLGSYYAADVDAEVDVGSEWKNATVESGHMLCRLLAIPHTPDYVRLPFEIMWDFA